MKTKLLGFVLFIFSIVIIWRFVTIFVPWHYHLFIGWFTHAIYQAAFDWQNEVNKFIDKYEKWA